MRDRAEGVDAVYFSMHGAMGAVGELDPEGYLLEETRRILGPKVPIVISLDLHGILTQRMLRQVDGVTIYHTYPHVDFADTGARAARLLLRILGGARTTIARRSGVQSNTMGPSCHNCPRTAAPSAGRPT